MNVLKINISINSLGHYENNLNAWRKTRILNEQYTQQLEIFDFQQKEYYESFKNYLNN